MAGREHARREQRQPAARDHREPAVAVGEPARDRRWEIHPRDVHEMTSPTADRDSPAPCMWIGVIVITATIATFDAAITTTPIKASRGQEGRLLRTLAQPAAGSATSSAASREASSGSGRSSTSKITAAITCVDHRDGERRRAGKHAEGVGERLGRRGEVRAGDRAPPPWPAGRR